MKNSRDTPGVNAGSMADIAFLLLIFFLVTTTIPNDKGIVRGLPRPCTAPPCHEKLNERNILRIALNKNGELMVDKQLTPFKELKDIIIGFIDNNGDQTCDYCFGNGLKNSSDNPRTAIISLSSNRETAYKDFITIQNELTSAYFELRKTFVEQRFNKNLGSLSKEELRIVKDAYPLLISEADLK